MRPRDSRRYRSGRSALVRRRPWRAADRPWAPGSARIELATVTPPGPARVETAPILPALQCEAGQDHAQGRCRVTRDDLRSPLRVNFPGWGPCLSEGWPAAALG